MGTPVARDVAETDQQREGWGRTASLAGTIAAAALLLQTLLFLVDATGMLPGNPPFRETGAGRAEDLADFFVAWFERQHDIAWNIALRDVLGPIGAVALIVLARALVRLRGRDRAGAEAWAVVFAVGALLKLLSDLTYLSQLGIWRATGFTPDPPADIIAAGRTSEFVTSLADHLEHAALVALAVGLVGLSRLLGPRVRLLALVEAIGLLLSTAAALAELSSVYAVTALLTGVVLAPALLVALGRSLAASPGKATATRSTTG